MFSYVERPKISDKRVEGKLCNDYKWKITVHSQFIIHLFYKILLMQCL